jgi:hypothetical protein
MLNRVGIRDDEFHAPGSREKALHETHSPMPAGEFEFARASDEAVSSAGQRSAGPRQS